MTGTYLEQEGLDNINLFSTITIISFSLLVPIAIVMEGFKFTPSYLQQYSVRTFYIRSKRIHEFDIIMIWYILIQARQGLNLKDLCLKIVLSGVCFHSYQQVRFPTYYYMYFCLPNISHRICSLVYSHPHPFSPVATSVWLFFSFLFFIVDGWFLPSAIIKAF